jgi:uncharacterized membrane-anchored protein
LAPHTPVDSRPLWINVLLLRNRHADALMYRCASQTLTLHLTAELAMLHRLMSMLIALVMLGSVAHARPFRELFPTRTYENPEAQRLVESFDYRQGTIALPETGVELRVPESFYFLGSEDARRVLVTAWQNPPSMAEHVLGMIFPAARSPVDDTWGAVITYDADGYVSDEDAARIDYSELLKNMQEATLRSSEARVKEGYPTIQLVGWASPPYYDKATAKLHWAKELAFGGQDEHTLNYFVRALGRRGVLNINFVAAMDQLAEIRSVIPTVLSMPEFIEGSKYTDYVPSTDKVAAYGIGGLIAGSIAQKLGLFALALVFLKKGWIVLLLALGGAWKGLVRLFTRKQPE